jgi:hypothetical protein
MIKWIGQATLTLAITFMFEGKGCRAAPQPETGKTLYECNFENSELGQPPEELLILEGRFSVKQEGTNKLLELPGAPADSFGVLFGPAEAAGLAVSARMRSTATGKRLPAFAVGLNGVGGYRLQVSPGRRALELFKGEALLRSVPFAWEAGSWTWLRLQLRAVKAGEWQLEGRAWKRGAREPATWLITATETTPLAAGRPSVWGLPYATTPIQFDDLAVTEAR